jgi:hypothetical protein
MRGRKKVGEVIAVIAFVSRLRTREDEVEVVLHARMRSRRRHSLYLTFANEEG